jgi:hypothetical protein
VQPYEQGSKELFTGPLVDERVLLLYTGFISLLVFSTASLDGMSGFRSNLVSPTFAWLQECMTMGHER